MELQDEVGFLSKTWRFQKLPDGDNTWGALQAKCEIRLIVVICLIVTCLRCRITTLVLLKCMMRLIVIILSVLVCLASYHLHLHSYVYV